MNKKAIFSAIAILTILSSSNLYASVKTDTYINMYLQPSVSEASGNVPTVYDTELKTEYVYNSPVNTVIEQEVQELYILPNESVEVAALLNYPDSTIYQYERQLYKNINNLPFYVAKGDKIEWGYTFPDGALNAEVGIKEGSTYTTLQSGNLSSKIWSITAANNSNMEFYISNASSTPLRVTKVYVDTTPTSKNLIEKTEYTYGN